MALKIYSEPTTTDRDRRDMLAPFLKDESGIKALQGYINSDNSMSREGMYTLEILNNLIQSNYGTKDLFQRIPQEVFGGCAEGGRRNVEASLIGRAGGSADAQERGRILESGYTTTQERIGKWAERDGSWSDQPDHDLESKGLRHVQDRDGSEAHVFTTKGEEKNTHVYKTIDMSHYSDLELLLDRIAIHNATFPEMAMHVVGFGLRENPIDNKDFVVTVKQPFAIGERPTLKEIEEGMAMRGFNKSENGVFFISPTDNVVLADIHPENCVVDKAGNLLVFDCEAFLKHFHTETIIPERYAMSEIAPDRTTGKFKEEAWKAILGPEYPKATDEDKSRIYKDLRLNGAFRGMVNGKMIVMDKPLRENVNINGKTIPIYRGDILVGHPDAFKKEHTYRVPELKYDDAAVNDIRKTIAKVVPQSMDMEEFLYSRKHFGDAGVAPRGIDRAYYRENLKKLGYIPVPDPNQNKDYFVQVDPQDPTRVLIGKKDNIRFMLWTTFEGVEGLGKLSPSEKDRLASGGVLDKDGQKYQFDLDKGRVVKLGDGMKLYLGKNQKEKRGEKQKKEVKVKNEIKAVKRPIIKL